MEILREYIEDDMQVTEYTKDGQTTSHIIKIAINTGPGTPPGPSIEQQILYENQYQTMLLEMGGIR